MPAPHVGASARPDLRAQRRIDRVGRRGYQSTAAVESELAWAAARYGFSSSTNRKIVSPGLA